MKLYNKNGRRKFVRDVSLFTVSSIILPFQSCNLNSNNIRFGLTTDSHYADRSSSGSRYYKQSLEKMREFIKEMNDSKVDFVIHLGDLKDEAPDKQEEDTLRFLREIEQTYAEFKGPRYHCIGNHDLDSINKEQFLSVVENTGISKNKSYYSFDKRGFHFVVLDANYDRNGNSHFYKEGADWEDTNITPEQVDWLRQDLKMNNLPTVIFCHHPLFKYFRDGNKYHVNNFKEIQELINSNQNTISVFQGHVHEEKFKKIGGVHYITQLGMVDFQGLTNNSFALIEIGEGKIQINGYKRTSTKRKSYRL
ncbi:metallophosphoesterase [Saprospiraceae bacterium]|nr:metallophosphoesterase [Saprospiraceae bacterium]MDC3253377.1 metallophosphoesterase [bacterium]